MYLGGILAGLDPNASSSRSLDSGTMVRIQNLDRTKIQRLYIRIMYQKRRSIVTTESVVQQGNLENVVYPGSEQGSVMAMIPARD
jgi:hypothetical protein